MPLRDLHLETEYRTGQVDLVEQFYAPCLRNARAYDRAVGYFRSTVYDLFRPAVVDFVKKGGRMRVVCSPQLHKEDIEALGKGYRTREEVIGHALDREVTVLLEDELLRPRSELLATLIALNILDVKVAVRPMDYGIFHEKVGLFIDASGDVISFKGSSNETWSGWHRKGNLESIEVFCSWREGLEAERVERHQDHFLSLWNDKIPTLAVHPFPEAVKNHLCTIAKASVYEFDEPDTGDMMPRKKRSPLPHQRRALDDWVGNGRRGILKHATGSGKTFTALLAIKEHLSEEKPALIVVPSRLLLSQWVQEIESEIPGATVLKAGAGYRSWKKTGRLAAFTRPGTAGQERVVVATMATARATEFRREVVGGDHLLLIADEVHQIGSPENSNILSVKSGSRLGLSATPERYGDHEGTERLFDYFGGIVGPVVTLSDAIHSGRLVPYQYFPHRIPLTDSESADWSAYTERIGRLISAASAGKDGDIVITDQVKLLLINRARIAKKAVGKIDLVGEVLKRGFSEGQRWLVYCEDQEQLNEVLTLLRSEGFPAASYHSAMEGDAKATMEWLDRFGGVIVSIRCLDEGVDIPSVSHALILASSQNPREFIQRRGRVLRNHPGKTHAIVHDAVVVPNDLGLYPEQTNLAINELARAYQFAQGAENRIAAMTILDVAADLGIDIDMAASKGVENDE
jgi:superfamily II DNA or RNA helicase